MVIQPGELLDFSECDLHVSTPIWAFFTLFKAVLAIRQELNVADGFGNAFKLFNFSEIPLVKANQLQILRTEILS